MARIIDLGVTKEMLTQDNFPSIKILDKCYVVDNRQKTWNEIQKIQRDEKLTPQEIEDKVYELALGKQALEEIRELNLPCSVYTYLSFCVMGAITDKDPKELQKLAEAQSKN
jgi:hypothetical protein